jgi:hypothetical protein
MKNEILSNSDNAEALEALYRSDKVAFKRAFNELYADHKHQVLFQYWNERLNYKKDEGSPLHINDVLFILIASFLAGIVAKFPAIFSLNEELFYSRNIGFIVFPALTAFFVWKNKLESRKMWFLLAAGLVALVYINLLPKEVNSDSINLACMHLVLFLWALLGISFLGNDTDTLGRRLAYLKYNGDLVVITTLILVAGGVLTGITLGLFSLIGLEIADFYFNYIVIFALPAAPIIGTYLTQSNPQLVGKVSPVIAQIFSPLVLIMLVIYLVAIVYSGKNPYTDREFLLIFNALLIGVMAIIFFSIAETSKTEHSQRQVWVLLLLSLVTIIVNGIALSAIVFRISEWGITPNRLAVLGGNLLILIHLLLVSRQMFRVTLKKSQLKEIGISIASYLPVYVIWTIIVTFLFPLIFGFK